MFFSLLLILVGLVALAGGGEVLLRGSVGLAQRLQLTPAVIGLTVVAAGTSVPELAVSLLASLRGSSDIAVGNVVGSNILNVTLILGAAALITPLAVTGNMIKLEYPAMALVTFLAVAIFEDGVVNRMEALLLIATYAGFTAYLIGVVRDRIQVDEGKQLAQEVSELAPEQSKQDLQKILGLIIGGVILLSLGAEATVRGAVEIGRTMGMSERVIGLTIVACGTSLPEIVTSLIAGVRGRDDIAIGNVVGSNLFNIAGILGLSALISPLAVSADIRGWDAYWMLGVAVALFPIMRSGMKIERREGGILLGIFALYWLTLLF